MKRERRENGNLVNKGKRRQTCCTKVNGKRKRKREPDEGEEDFTHTLRHNPPFAWEEEGGKRVITKNRPGEYYTETEARVN